MTRICACGCGQEFEPGKFHPHQKYYNGQHGQRAYARKHRKKVAEYIHSVLARRGCRICRITDVRVLDFHHRNPNEKKFRIWQMMHLGRARMDEEIAKCDVLCANHHRIVEWEAEQARS